jgi:hypothetical protein
MGKRKRKKYENEVNYNNRSEQQKQNSRGKLVSLLSTTSIPKLPVIAQLITDYKNQENYKDLFAYKVVEQKLLKTQGVKIRSEKSTLTFGIDYGGVYFGVEYSIGKLFPNNTRSYLVSFIENFDKKINQKGYGFRGGIIHFLPKIVNKNDTLNKIEKKLPITFVDTPYNPNNLEGLTKQYCKK